MRTLLIIFFCFFTAPIVVAPTVPKPKPVVIAKEPEPVIVKDYYLFLHDLGHQESGNRYDVVNQFGYMGRYQFGKSTLRTLKIRVSKEAFLNSPDL